MRQTKQGYTGEGIEEAWTLGPDEILLVVGKRGPTRLGFAVLVRFFAKANLVNNRATYRRSQGWQKDSPPEPWLTARRER